MYSCCTNSIAINIESITPHTVSTVPLLGLLAGVVLRQDVFGPNPQALHMEGHTCTDALHQSVACCVPEPTGLPMVVALAGLPLVSWTSFIVWGVRIFCIGGLVHAWYFAPSGLTPSVGCL